MGNNRYRFTFSDNNKLLFPKSRTIKSDLIKYYARIANYMLPYLKDRPLTMQRFPKGISEKGFFQKNASLYFPDWIPTVDVRKVDGWVHHVLCNSKEVLLYLVNQYVITFHISLSTIDAIEYPDRLIFDLDPPDGNFELAVEGARALRQLLENELGFKTFLMTTGSKGLHVVVPLKKENGFNEVHSFAKAISTQIVNEHPDKFTTAIRKNKRDGHLYIDFLRNSYSQTSVAPYSVRAIENAPIAVPIYWDELNNASLNAQLFTTKNIFKRLEEIKDPWRDFKKNAQNICRAEAALKEISKKKIPKKN